jgi:hypothetical protein
VKTISIQPFHNRTEQIGVELALATALADVVRERGVLQVVAGERGDLLLTGKVHSFASRAVAYSKVDEAVQYAVTMVLDASLRRRGGDKPLWVGRQLVESLDAGVTPGVVIPSSPRFQQGTLNARDLSGLTKIQLAEDQRSEEVLRQLVDEMARSIYSQMMEGF